jgi:hypothetical protein
MAAKRSRSGLTGASPGLDRRGVEIGAVIVADLLRIAARRGRLGQQIGDHGVELGLGGVGRGEEAAHGSAIGGDVRPRQPGAIGIEVEIISGTDRLVHVRRLHARALPGRLRVRRGHGQRATRRKTAEMTEGPCHSDGILMLHEGIILSHCMSETRSATERTKTAADR